MGNDWAIEAHNKTGKRFLYHRAVSRKEVRKLVAQALAKSSTGGVVIYRSTATVAERLEVTEADLQRIWDEATEKDREAVFLNDVPDDHPGYAENSRLNDLECETEDEENPENFEKVASSNNWLSVVIAAAEDNGGCQVCGCPPEDMPMVNRNTGWCSEGCRKQQAKNALRRQQLARGNNDSG